jgi:hypothetical protein
MPSALLQCHCGRNWNCERRGQRTWSLELPSQYLIQVNFECSTSLETVAAAFGQKLSRTPKLGEIRRGKRQGFYVLPVAIPAGAACAATARARTVIVEIILTTWPDIEMESSACERDGDQPNRGKPLDFISSTSKLYSDIMSIRIPVRFGPVRPDATITAVQEGQLDRMPAMIGRVQLLLTSF